MSFQTIPVIRIFDIEKARDFYLHYLGMQMDWEHRGAPHLPVYMQVSRADFILHLSEHAGDCSPGSKTFVNVNNVRELFEELKNKGYKGCHLALETAPWGDLCFTVTDPFSNRIFFNEPRHVQPV